MNDANVPWFLNMLKADVFEGAEVVSKEQFFHVRGEGNDFWEVVSQIAVEKFNMEEVSNMCPSVRPAAIEKFGQCDKYCMCSIQCAWH